MKSEQLSIVPTFAHTVKLCYLNSVFKYIIVYTHLINMFKGANSHSFDITHIIKCCSKRLIFRMKMHI